MRRVVFVAPDISCTSCAQAITNTLSPVKGVKQVQVDVAARRVVVLLAEEASVEDILHQLDEAGFPATVVAEDQS